jgi:OOP family OmpA-OmpF porin
LANTCQKDKLLLYYSLFITKKEIKMKKTMISMAMLCLTAMSSLAHAEGYLVDSRGQVVRSGTGLCIRTGFWTPADATPECDASLVKAKVEPTVFQEKTLEAPTVINEAQYSKEVLSADVLFGFNKYHLTKEGQDLLTRLSNHTSDKDVKAVIVVGYADPIGSDSYNQKLSERRAQTVKEFLIANGFQSESIQTTGLGETELKVTKEDCKGKGMIQCLAPDRRVEITISTHAK